MSNSINLSAAIRNSLLSLQNAQGLINTTQNDLSTGLKVNNAVDNPVSYFQGAALSDRASDFGEKKQAIDQGVSSLSTALEGVSGIESLLQQLEGLAQSALSATSTQEKSLVTQFNALRTQINTLATDTQYQGLNLVAGTGQTLVVGFSTLTASNLTVKSVDVTAGARGLAIAKAATSTSNVTHFQVDFDSQVKKAIKLSAAGTFSTVTFYYAGTAASYTAGTSLTFDYGSLTFTVSIGSVGGSKTYTNTAVFTQGQAINFKTIGNDAAAASAAGTVAANVSLGAANSSSLQLNTVTGAYILNASVQPSIQLLMDKLAGNLTTLRTQAQTIGSNVALLNTRLDFTNNYVNLLSAGSGKLTLADLNAEGANLLSLQTRQQLGIQALSFAGQSERAVLQLFR